MDSPDANPPPSPSEALGGPDRAPLLALQLHSGEEDALGPWYEAEYPTVHRLCLGFLARRSEADDVAQDAMLHLLDKISKWDPFRPYISWRNTVVLNLCRDRLREVARQTAHEERVARMQSELGSEALLEQPSKSASAEEMRAWLERSLALLAPREREAFVLIDLEGFTAGEAADQLGLSPSTLRASLTLARRKLRTLLAPYKPHASASPGGAS
jgi:RNA polymerase sigma-70 factor (ECF subfamily)